MGEHIFFTGNNPLQTFRDFLEFDILFLHKKLQQKAQTSAAGLVARVFKFAFAC